MAFSSEAHPLDRGVYFPAMSLITTGETSLCVPATSDGFTVVLLYRGEW
jgi:hypothetical protein